MRSMDKLEWGGAITGSVGSLLLATNTMYSGWGFPLFLISNGFWIAFGLQKRAPGLVAMQLVFTATSAVGVYRWLIGPALLGI